MKLRYICFLLLFCVTHSFAAIPPTYYNRADGLKKAQLKAAMKQIIGYAEVLGYGSGAGKTWTGFYSTDRCADGQVRDRYSYQKFYFAKSDNVAAASAPAGLNIEHSFPKSWWGGTTNQAYKDLYNLMPSEQKINSSKSNSPMGKVTSDTGGNGCTKVGKGNAGGVTTSLWEPADEWKGDFARSYFYMVTSYSDLVWEGEGLKLLEQNEWPTLQKWAYELFVEWSRQDPVDQIEAERNEAVYKIQGNRNPFVDFPNLCEYIWGDSTDVSFSVANTKKYGDADEPAELMPEIALSTDKVSFVASEGLAPKPVMVSARLHDISDNTLTATVDGPFLLADDDYTAPHVSTLTMTGVNPSFYVYMMPQAEGDYKGMITLTAAGAAEKTIQITAHVGEIDVEPDIVFFETFETGTKGAYAAAEVQCQSTSWYMSDALIGVDVNANDTHAVRIKSGGYIVMTKDKNNGCGTVAFYAGLYNNDTGVNLSASYSTDGGAHWTEIFSALSVGSWEHYSYPVNVEGKVRLKFEVSGTSGKRLNLDDIEVSDYPAASGIDATAADNADVWYDLQGRVVTSLRRGIYVTRSGKKVFRF